MTPAPKTTCPLCGTADAYQPMADSIHPGEYVREEMQVRGWSIDSLARATGIGQCRLEEIIAGKRPLTLLDCHCLGKAFGTSIRVWMNLQAVFEEREVMGNRPILTRGIQPDVPPNTPQYKCPACGAAINTLAAYEKAAGPGMPREDYSDELGCFGCAKCRNPKP